MNSWFAYFLYYWLLERSGATNLSLVTYLLPMSGVLWGALLLHERLIGPPLWLWR